MLLFVVGIAMAVGKASVFKFISDEFGQNIGAVSGIVGLAGGLGGFILPILFGVLLDRPERPSRVAPAGLIASPSENPDVHFSENPPSAGSRRIPASGNRPARASPTATCGSPSPR